MGSYHPTVPSLHCTIKMYINSRWCSSSHQRDDVTPSLYQSQLSQRPNFHGSQLSQRWLTCCVCHSFLKRFPTRCTCHLALKGFLRVAPATAFSKAQLTWCAGHSFLKRPTIRATSVTALSKGTLCIAPITAFSKVSNALHRSRISQRPLRKPWPPQHVRQGVMSSRWVELECHVGKSDFMSLLYELPIIILLHVSVF